MKVFIKTLPYIKKYKYNFIKGIILIIVSNLMTLTSIIYIGKLMDIIQKILNNINNKFNLYQERYNILFYTFIIIILPIISSILKFFMRKIILTASRRIEFDIKNKIFLHYQKMNISFYKKRNIGDLMIRITEDVSMIRQYIGPSLIYIINFIIIIFIISLKMFLTDKRLSIYVLFPIPCLLIVLYSISITSYKRSVITQNKQSVVSSFIQETFSGIHTIKSFVSENFFQKKFSEIIEDYKIKKIDLSIINSMFYPFILFFISLSQLSILYIGAKRFFFNKMFNTNILTEFFIYINILNWPFVSISWVLTIAQRAKASQNRIDELLKITPTSISISENKPNIYGNIKIKNLNFCYPDSKKLVLNNISFNIKKGENIAIIGESGSGKSTLINVFMQIYQPSSGNIYIDNIDIRNINLEYIRDNIGYTPKEPYLFHETIYNNIKYGRLDASEEEVYKAARESMIENEILLFKEGYNTFIGEEGSILSGGQKQRLCIARSLIKFTKILIFDDSLSAIDQYTKKKLLQNWKNIHSDKTCLFITHDINIAKYSDRILVLNNGYLIENGNHEDLISKKGFYYEYYIKNDVY